MKCLKSCLPKGNLLDTTILISISFIEIRLLYWWNLNSSISVSSNFKIFLSAFTCGFFFLIIFLIYNLKFFLSKSAFKKNSFKLAFWSKSIFPKLIFLNNFLSLHFLWSFFFAFFNIFFFTQKAFVFHLLVDFCIVHDHIVAFLLFLL